MMGSKRKKRWNGRRLLVMLLCALLLMPQLGAAGTAEAAEEDHLMNQFINGGALYLEDEEWHGERPDHETPLKNGDQVSVDDILVLEYRFNLEKKDTEYIDDQIDKTYTISPPKGLVWSGNKEETDELKLEGGEADGKTFATLKFGGEGKEASITFVDKLTELSEGGIENAYFYLGCRLDKKEMKPPTGSEEYTFKLAESDSVTLKIKENMATQSKLKDKKGVEEAGVFHWTIEYEPGNKETTKPFLVDTFDSTLHTYVEDSFEVASKGGAEIEITEGDLEVTEDKENNTTTISYKIPNETSDPLTITYDTQRTDAGMALSKTETIKNKAELREELDKKPMGEGVEASLPVKPLTWLEKSGEYIGDKKEIQWKVTIHTNNKKLSKLILTDALKDGQEGLQHLTFDAGSFKINNTNSFENIATLKMNDENKGFTLTFKTQNVTLEETYTVTYTTKIAEEYFHGENQQEILNGAKLEFAWPNGNNGEYQPENPPKIEVGVPADGRLVKKEAKGYDPATHKLTWQVTVNPYNLKLEDVVVTDDLTDKGQTYVKGSFKELPESEQPSKSGFDNENEENFNLKQLKLNIRDLNQKSYQFQFETTVDEPLHYAYNSETTYTNTISAEANLQPDGGELKHLTADDTATQDVKSNVLKKEDKGYNYSTKEITWKVTVNDNMMPMPEAVIVDTLPQGLSYVDGSAKIDDEAIGAEKVKVNGQELTINLEGECNKATKTITYQTKVDVDAIPDFKEKETVEIENKVKLQREKYPDQDQEERATQSISNQMLDKKGEYKREEGAIHYSVNLNPHGLTLQAQADGTKTQIRDELPEGLQLDPDTIKLYKATVRDDGGFEKGAEVLLTRKTNYDYNVKEGWFTISLEASKDSYVLEYTADVVDESKESFTNNISMSGTVSGNVDSESNNVGLGSGGGGGGGSSSPKVNLTITKTDESGAKNLEGAKFELFQGEDSIAEATTDAKGKAEFKYLKKGKTFTLKEVEAPEGYLPELGEIKGLTVGMDAELGDDKNTVTFTTTDDTPKNFGFTLTNKPVTGTIQFTKANDLGAKPAGAEFELAKVEDSSFAKRTATSDKDGKVTFENVPYGTYEIKETKAPANHEPSNETYTATITENGKTVGLDGVLNNTVINTVKKGESCDLHITKLDRQTKEPMQGVVFTYTDEAGKSVETGPTDEGGKLTVQNLKMGKTYNFKEKQPEGYKPWSGTVTMDQAEVEWTIYNDKEISGGLPEEEPVDYTMTVKDKETGEPVEGVTYNLWSKDKYPDWETALKNPPDQTKVSGKDGKVTFEDLPLGEYWIWEQSGPEGYEEEHTYLILTITKKDDGSKVFTLKDAGTGAAVDPDNVYLVPEEQEDPKDPTDPDNPQKPEGPEKPEKPGGAAGESHKEEAPNKSDKQPAGKGDKNDPAGSGGNETNIQSAQNKLPQTGQPWMQILLFAAAGAGLIAAGALLNRRQRQKK